MKTDKRKILVIDDSEAARAVICETLAAVGYEVFELASAIGATRTVLRNEIAAVIVDLSMPGLSGDMLVRVLRRNVRLARLVIIVVSGTDTAELESVRTQGGADAVLSKAHVQSDLVRVLAHLLEAPPPAHRLAASVPNGMPERGDA